MEKAKKAWTKKRIGAAGFVRSAGEQTKDTLQLKVIERMRHKTNAHAVEIN